MGALFKWSALRRYPLFLAAVAMVAALVLPTGNVAGAASKGGNTYQSTVQLKPSLNRTLLAQAPVDECYDPTSSTVSYPDANGNCTSGIPKASGSYLWGQTKLGDNIWFGTAQNYLCNVLAQFSAGLGQAPTPVKTDQMVCEYGQGAYYQANLAGNTQFSPSEGDWRPPHIYRWNTVSKTLTDMTPANDQLINLTEGFRAAGSVGNTVFLAGPVIGQANPGATDHGVTLFAFDNTSGALLGEANVPEFSNVRSFLTVGNSLYVGLMTLTGGVIARWVGTPADPFAGGDASGFEYVGRIPDGEGGPAELTYSQGHLVATTWNMGFVQQGGLTPGSSVFISGSKHDDPNDPFTTADYSIPWKSVWSPSEYEPDPVIRSTYQGAAVAAYGGYVYFATMHGVMAGSMLNILTRQQLGATLTAQDMLTALLNGNRSTTIWRVSNLDASKPTVELLYGESTLPAYDYFGGTGWTNQPTGWTPKWGPSGFGNPFNAYAWSMNVFQNQLYVGTFDWSYLLANGGSVLTEMLGGTIPANLLNAAAAILLAAGDAQYGADLARFPSPDQRAVFEDTTGIGDYLNYGVRTMTSDATGLYVGTANPANLATTPGQALGGWQLIKLAPKGRK